MCVTLWLSPYTEDVFPTHGHGGHVGYVEYGGHGEKEEEKRGCSLHTLYGKQTLLCTLRLLNKC